MRPESRRVVRGLVRVEVKAALQQLRQVRASEALDTQFRGFVGGGERPNGIAQCRAIVSRIFEECEYDQDAGVRHLSREKVEQLD